MLNGIYLSSKVISVQTDVLLGGTSTILAQGLLVDWGICVISLEVSKTDVPTLVLIAPKVDLGLLEHVVLV